MTRQLGNSLAPFLYAPCFLRPLGARRATSAKSQMPDAKDVFLQCSSIFADKPNGSKKLTKITSILAKHSDELKGLTRNYSMAKIASVVKQLNAQQIFTSPERARARFPELFESPEGREQERAASEQAALEANEQKVADKAREADDLAKDDELADRSVASESSDSEQHRSDLPIPRLHPVYLPFRTQHKILVPVQTILEQICFEYGQEILPDMMNTMEWMVPESLELSEWNKQFIKCVNQLPPGSFGQIPGKKASDVIFDTQILRHAAVHRLPTSAAGIKKMLDAAHDYAVALKDSPRAHKIKRIRDKLRSSIQSIVDHQNHLEQQYTPRFELIAQRRAELDREEQGVISEMFREDKAHRDATGTALESRLSQSLQDMETPSPDPDQAVEQQTDHDDKGLDLLRWFRWSKEGSAQSKQEPSEPQSEQTQVLSPESDRTTSLDDAADQEETFAASTGVTTGTHNVALKIHIGRIHRFVVSTRHCTRYDILYQARMYLLKLAETDSELEHLLGPEPGLEVEAPSGDDQMSPNEEPSVETETCHPSEKQEKDDEFEAWNEPSGNVLYLTGLQIKGEKMDLTSYPQNDLRGLIETVEQTELPRFSLELRPVEE